jgi:hypothetical protein
MENSKHSPLEKPDYTKQRKELLAILQDNKDDLGRTIITGAITDILNWHQSELESLRIEKDELFIGLKVAFDNIPENIIPAHTRKQLESLISKHE